MLPRSVSRKNYFSLLGASSHLFARGVNCPGRTEQIYVPVGLDYKFTNFSPSVLLSYYLSSPPLLSQGLTDWNKIRAAKEAISVPVFANENILYHSDIDRCLRATDADVVVSAERSLYTVRSEPTRACGL